VRTYAAALLLVGSAFGVACTGSKDSVPPGDNPVCVYNDGLWDCPGGNTYPPCPSGASQGEGPCHYDGGTCLACEVAGNGCTCRALADGGSSWECVATAEGCSGGP
jgi:hypothetical protein